MKGRKRGPARALAIILSSILMVSSVGLTVFADEQIPADEKVIVEGSADQQQAEEDIVQTGKNEAMQLADEPADEPDEVSAEEPAREPTEVSAEEPAELPAGEPSEEPTKEPAEEPAKEPAEEPAKEPAEVSAEEPTDEPADGGSAGDIAGETLPDAELSDDAMEEIDKAPLAEAVTNVTYIERSWDGKKVVKKETTRSEDISSFPNSANIPSGWYYLNKDVTIDGRVSLAGDTWLILGDGKTLDVEGLYVPKGSTLTVYAQSDGKGAGSIISKPDKGGAGIGATSDNHPGGDIFIHGGTVTAVGDDHCAGIGSNDGNGTTSNITIYGGTITATGGSNGAGIGGGRYCDAGGIQIYSGTVTATGKGNSAGIGGGDPGSGSNGNGGVILITGGTVTATGSGKGAGIGGSQKGSAQVYIEGGVINAGSGSGGVGIGHGADCTSVGDDDGIYLSWSSVSKNTISIAASSFKGEVKLDDPFCNDAYAFGAGTYTDNTQLSQLADSPLTAWDETVRNWAELQRFINISRDGIETKIKLAADIIATETDSCLNVPAGKMIDIDLDGFTIDRNLGSLTEGVSGGGVFHVKSNAYLTIHDESSEKTGTVRGGRNSGNGGGIYNEGTLYIEGCTITDCQSSENGGGIYSKGTLTISKGTITECVAIEDGGGVCNGGTYTDGKDCKVTMESCTITNNTSRAGGGVCNYYGELVITGGTISGNKVELSGGGIHLYYGTADISGGLITDNGTTKGAGGGIFLFYSTLTLSGGSVSKNYAAESGGGIRVPNYSPGAADDPKLLIKGHPEVSDNTVNGAANNIDMDNMQLIKVVGKLDEDVVLGVILQNKSGNCSGVITTGLDGNGTEANFRSDDSKYQVKLNVDGEAELVETPVVTINGVSGSFNDKIRLNYYFDFPDSVLDDEGAYVTLARKNEENPKKLLIKNAEKVPDKGYKFSIELVAKEASDTITARVYDSQDNRLTIIGDLKRGDYTETGVQYTLMEYFNWLSTSGETDKEKAVGAAAKDYCSAAQLYFKYNTKDVTVSSAVDAVTEKTLESYVASRSGTLPTGVSIKGISAMLESDNTLRLYLDFKNVDPAAFQYYIGEIKEDNKVELKQRSDKMYYLALDTGVFSNHLQDTHKYSVSDGTNTYTITASVLTYARSCALKSNKAESNLGKALYLYNQAAVAAFGD